MFHTGERSRPLASRVPSAYRNLRRWWLSIRHRGFQPPCPLFLHRLPGIWSRATDGALAADHGALGIVRLAPAAELNPELVCPDMEQNTELPPIDTFLTKCSQRHRGYLPCVPSGWRYSGWAAHRVLPSSPTWAARYGRDGGYRRSRIRSRYDGPSPLARTSLDRGKARWAELKTSSKTPHVLRSWPTRNMSSNAALPLSSGSPW